MKSLITLPGVAGSTFAPIIGFLRAGRIGEVAAVDAAALKRRIPCESVLADACIVGSGAIGVGDVAAVQFTNVGRGVPPASKGALAGTSVGVPAVASGDCRAVQLAALSMGIPPKAAIGTVTATVDTSCQVEVSAVHLTTQNRGVPNEAILADACTIRESLGGCGVSVSSATTRPGTGRIGAIPDVVGLAITGHVVSFAMPVFAVHNETAIQVATRGRVVPLVACIADASTCLRCGSIVVEPD